jgi:tetratricopeptide (TPR) repeat protein
LSNALAGEAERLKGFAIAVDVFGKDAEFDSATDAVVRVRNIGGPIGFEVAGLGNSRGATSSINDTVDQLPAVHIHSSSEGGQTARVATVLRTALSGFDTIDLIARDRSDAARRPDATDFDFTVNAGPSAGSVLVELQHMTSGRILLSRVLSSQEISPDVIDDRIADIVSSTIPASGMIYSFIEQNGLQRGLTACLLLSGDYYMDQNAAKHRAAYQCMEDLSKRSAKSPVVYAELASLQLEAVTDNYPYPANATTEGAYALAHSAVQMGSTSPYAHRAFGYLQSRAGDRTEAIRWIRKAYELNTYDLTMAASYGYALILGGSYSDGVPIMKRAVESASAHPGWWDYGLFLGEFMLGNRYAAARAASALATNKKPHYVAARLIAANFVGDTKLASELSKEIATRYPAFANDPAATFAKGKYPAELTKSLTKALRAAGLGHQI